MTLIAAPAGPAGHTSVIHTASGLLSHAPDSLLECHNNRAILIYMTSNDESYEMYAGQAYLDLIKSVTLEVAGIPTMTDIQQYVTKQRGLQLHGSHNVAVTDASADRADGYQRLEGSLTTVLTFHHGWYWGRGSSSSGAEHTSATSYVKTMSNIFRTGVNRASNTAYIFAPSDSSITSIISKFVDTQSYEETGNTAAVRTLIKSSMVDLLTAHGIDTSKRYMDPVAFSWADDTSNISYLKPYLQPKVGANHASDTNSHEYPILGGRVKRLDNLHIHSIPFSMYAPSHFHGDFSTSTYGNESTYVTADDELNPIMGHPTSLITENFSISEVPLVTLMSGQPFSKFYDPVDNSVKTLTHAGTELLTNAAITRRAGFTLNVDSDPGNVITDFEVEGVASQGLLTTYLDANRDKTSGGHTQYDTIALTARKMLRMIVECVDIVGSDLTWDSNLAGKILKGES